MDLQDIKTFVEAADAGGVAPAARRLGLAKSIVSRQISRLEQELGVQLLTRSPRGSVLTQAGTSFREHAGKILSEVDAARESIAADGELRGVFRITAPLSFGTRYLAPVLAQLARRHPQLDLDISFSDRVADLVGEGFDAAIRIGILPDSQLVARRIRTFRGSLVASPEYIARRGAPGTWEDLVQHEVVARRGEVWQVPGKPTLALLRPRGRFTADNGEAVLAAAMAGVGIAALPDLLTEAHVKQGHLVVVLPDLPAPELGLFVVRPPGMFPSRRVRALIEILAEHFGAAGDPHST